MAKIAVLLAGGLILMSSAAFAADDYDFSPLKCTDQAVLKALYSDLNDLSKQTYNVDLVDIKDVKHIKSTKKAIDCKGTLVFGDGDVVKSLFGYELNSVGVPIVNFKRDE